MLLLLQLRISTSDNVFMKSLTIQNLLEVWCIWCKYMKKVTEHYIEMKTITPVTIQVFLKYYDNYTTI